MRNKFTSFIMSIISILIVVIIGFFGYIFYIEISTIEIAKEPERVQTVFSDDETTNSEQARIETPKIIENPFDKIKDGNNNTNNTSNDYGQVQVDKYFYNQLEDTSKTIYRALESNKEAMKTGTYQIDFGSAFSSILNETNGQKKLGEYYQSAIEAYTYDNPEIFYISPNKMYLNIETTETRSGKNYNVFINNGNESNYWTTEFSSKAQIDSAISQVESIKNTLVSKKTGNTYNDIKMVHDYLVDNLEYDTSISKPNIYNIYGGLVSHVAVCEGYARAFKYIMDEMQIPSVLVIGKGTNSQGQSENHAWNYVNVRGGWYAIDTTWDDPVIIGGGTLSNDSKYRFFLKGSNTFNKDHYPSGQFTEGGKVFNYPTIEINDL